MRSKLVEFERTPNEKFVLSPFHFHNHYEFLVRVVVDGEELFFTALLDTGSNVCGVFSSIFEKYSLIRRHQILTISEFSIYSWREKAVVNFNEFNFLILDASHAGRLQQVLPDIIFGWDCFFLAMNYSIEILDENGLSFVTFVLHGITKESVSLSDQLIWEKESLDRLESLYNDMVSVYPKIGNRRFIRNLEKERKAISEKEKSCAN